MFLYNAYVLNFYVVYLKHKKYFNARFGNDLAFQTSMCNIQTVASKIEQKASVCKL